MSTRLQGTTRSQSWKVMIALLAVSFTASCRKEGKLLEGGTPGVTPEGSTELLIALPIVNMGVTDAHDVRVREIELRGGRLDLPAVLPLDLGTIGARGRKVVQIRFNVAGLDLSKSYEVELEGRYRGRRVRD